MNKLICCMPVTWLILSLVFLLCKQTLAQKNDSLNPSSTATFHVLTNSYEEFTIYIKNNYSSSIQMNWTKINQNLPAGWDYALCDYQTCYPGIPSSGSMSPILPGDSGYFKLNILSGSTS